MKRIEFGSYNEKRWGKPWAAEIKVEKAKVIFVFFNDAFAGDDTGGTLVFKTEKNHVYAYGQKDYRGNGSYIKYFGIDSDGKERALKNKGDARDFLFRVSKKELI